MIQEQPLSTSEQWSDEVNSWIVNTWSLSEVHEVKQMQLTPNGNLTVRYVSINWNLQATHWQILSMIWASDKEKL